MLVEIMEPLHVLEATQRFPSPVALNGGFVVQPGHRYLVLRFVHEYEDIQVAVLGYREFGGYLNFYDPARTLPLISDRLINLVNALGSAFLQGRESAPRSSVAPAANPAPMSDTSEPFDLPHETVLPILAATSAVTNEPKAQPSLDDKSDSSTPSDQISPKSAPDIDGTEVTELGEKSGDSDSLELDALLGVGNDRADLGTDLGDDARDNPLADLGFGEDDVRVPDDSEPLSQDSIDDLFG